MNPASVPLGASFPPTAAGTAASEASGRRSETVNLSGELGLAEAVALRQSLAALTQAGADVVVDLGEVSHLGGAVVQVLLVAERQAATAGAGFRLKDAREPARSMFGLAGLEPWVESLITARRS